MKILINIMCNLNWIEFKILHIVKIELNLNCEINSKTWNGIQIQLKKNEGANWSKKYWNYAYDCDIFPFPSVHLGIS